MQALVRVGVRVIVQFGNKKIVTAVVALLHRTPPKKYEAREILELLDTQPMVTEKQIRLFEWMAEYYMCTVGEVLNVALPSGLKISSQSRIQLKPESDFQHSLISQKELRLVQALEETHSLSYEEASQILEVNNIYHILKSLIEKDIVLVYEELKEKYQPKMLKKVRLTQNYLTKPELEKLSKKLEKTPKQLDILLYYLRNVPVFKDWTLNENGLEKKNIVRQEELSESSFQTLLKNKVFEEFEVVVSRLDELEIPLLNSALLSEKQQEILDEIFQCFKRQDVALLHGVTGSGKTEVFIHLIKKVLESGSQVLYLLPEIALTTQIMARLKKVFGNQVGVYHSKFSDNERVEVWQGVVNGKFNFVVGVRSAIFLPFDNLGLIIVDEEHEPSYKQYDPAPRYHARDMAMVIARMQHCKVLLGSATPSTESYYAAKSGKFGLVQLYERFGTAELPDVELADLKAERKAKTMKGHFSSKLIIEIEQKLKAKEQVILFQNRRGYSPYVTCRECNWIPKCIQCDVSLTYHLHENEIRCHYCGYHEHPPVKCPVCGSTRLETVGMGTEKIEDDLKIIFPEADIRRMDLDTTKSKNSYQQILSDFERRSIDILIGTQMVSKGLDFDNVGLVGIFDADRMLNFPDFRAHERAFQLMVQVSGRAGRKDKKGKVVIQTANIHQQILHKIIHNDYESMYLEEIEDRAYFFYPPFTRLIRLTTRHTEKDLSLKAAETLVARLSEKLGKARVLGPETPLVHKIRNNYLFHILIKVEKENVDLKAVKKFVQSKIEEVSAQKEFKKVQVQIDVDPV